MELRSPKNPLVQAQKKLRRNPPFDEGKVIVEGVRLIEEALRSGVTFETLFFTANERVKLESLLSNLRASELSRDLTEGQITATEDFQSSEIVNKISNSYLVSEEVMKAVSLETTPPGLWGLAKISSIPLNFEKDIVVLCGVRDPGNAGTILRTAEAVDCSVFFSKDSVHPYHPKVVKGSMGSSFRVPADRGDFQPFLEKLKANSFEIVGTTPASGISFETWSPKNRFALLLGGETSGLPDDIKKWADKNLSIPLLGKVESLNVAIAAAVILFHARCRISRQSA